MMNPRRSLLLLFLTAAPSIAYAQAFLPVVDHIHLAAPDPEKALAWYRQQFGGAEGKDRLMYGETRIIFQNAQPSQGSAVDHITIFGDGYRRTSASGR